MLLIEGDIRAIRSQIQEDALLGAISAIAVFWQVGVLWSPDAPATAKLLATMWRHVNQGLSYEVALRAKKPGQTGRRRRAVFGRGASRRRSGNRALRIPALLDTQFGNADMVPGRRGQCE